MLWSPNVQEAADFLYLDSDTYFGGLKGRTDLPGHPSVKVLDMYDFPGYDLTPHKFLVIDGFVDQRLMYQQREQIRSFLDQGKIVLFFGNLYLPWLPGASLFVPKAIRHYLDYSVRIVRPHPIFEGVREEDLTFNKGVAGFFARGHHPLPPGAEVLLTLEGGEPITYIDRHSTKGTLFVHSGGNLLGNMNRGNSSDRIPKQLAAWLYTEYEQLGQRRTGV